MPKSFYRNNVALSNGILTEIKQMFLTTNMYANSKTFSRGCLLAVLLISGCSAPSQTPEEVVETYIQDVNNGNVDGVMDAWRYSVPAEQLKVFESDAKKLGNELKQEFWEKHGGIKEIELRRIEMDKEYSNVLAHITFEDGYEINPENNSLEFFEALFLPSSYHLTFEEGRWNLLMGDRATNERSAISIANAFLDSVLQADGKYSRYILNKNASSESRQLLAEVSQTIREFNTTSESYRKARKAQHTALRKGSVVPLELVMSQELYHEIKLNDAVVSNEHVVADFHVKLMLPDKGILTLRGKEIVSLDGIRIPLLKSSEKWQVDISEMAGIHEIKNALRHEISVKQASLITIAQQGLGQKSSTASSAPPSNPKVFAKTVARAVAKRIMKSMGGGQDLVINVTGYDFDQSLNQYEIDIAVSFNGAVFRSNNYQCSGRVTVNPNGSNARFARTGANQNFIDNAKSFEGLQLTAEIIQALDKASK